MGLANTDLRAIRAAYGAVFTQLSAMSEEERLGHLRALCRADLYFLIRYACNRKDLEHPWLYERCREVQRAPDGYCDLWARDHYKSTIITFGLTIQDILASHGKDPLPHWGGEEVTFGFFSHTRPLAKDVLRQVKQELEQNRDLQAWFPDVLYADPKSQSPKWSEDEGIQVIRKSNPREATIEAWGLVDGQPTGKHYLRMVYDDVVVEGSVSSPDMIDKTTKSWALSTNLRRRTGRPRYIGTRWHQHDTYREIVRRGAAIERRHPITAEGTEDGTPVLLTKDEVASKRREQGPYVFASQQLLNPTADKLQGFQRDWLRYWRVIGWEDINRYIVVDPASGKNRDKDLNDYTAMWVIGACSDRCYRVIDVIRDRLNLTDRTTALFDLHRKYSRPRNRVIAVGYEEYGLQADIEHIKYVQQAKNYSFTIVPLGGAMDKDSRIRRLVPVFERGEMLLPASRIRQNHRGEAEDLVRTFLETEYDDFPVCAHKDMLDALARILDPELRVAWPEDVAKEDLPAWMNGLDMEEEGSATAWMGN